jgi:hypothetical protein
MNTMLHPSALVQSVLLKNDRSVVELVDLFLAICHEHNLQIDWQAGRCRVRVHDGDWDSWFDLPIHKSVFRAILARIATLCNERMPGSVSPYGGQGELSVDLEPPAVFQVRFVNTPGEQRLELGL